MNNSDRPAQPSSAWVLLSEINDRQCNTGLTKREHFAGLAMQNIINRYNPWEQGDFDSSEYEIVAENAVGLADALLKELDKCQSQA